MPCFAPQGRNQDAISQHFLSKVVATGRQASEAAWRPHQSSEPHAQVGKRLMKCNPVHVRSLYPQAPLSPLSLAGAVCCPPVSPQWPTATDTLWRVSLEPQSRPKCSNIVPLPPRQLAVVDSRCPCGARLELLCRQNATARLWQHCGCRPSDVAPA